MYKILLGIALIYAQEARSQQVIGNPFSPDDDMMTTFQKVVSKKDSQVVAVVQKPIIIEKKKDTVAVIAKVKTPPRVTVKTETVVTVTESEPEVEYIKPVIKKKVMTEDDYENTGSIVHAEGRTVGILFKSTTREKKYLLYKTVIQNRALSGQRGEDVYTGSYIIPTAWWYKNINDNTPTWEQVNYILLNYKVR